MPDTQHNADAEHAARMLLTGPDRRSCFPTSVPLLPSPSLAAALDFTACCCQRIGLQSAFGNADTARETRAFRFRYGHPHAVHLAPRPALCSNRWPGGRACRIHHLSIENSSCLRLPGCCRYWPKSLTVAYVASSTPIIVICFVNS